MSKSLKRVARVLLDANINATPVEMPGETRTAQQAADAVGCDLDQIAKSIVFQGPQGCVLFVTAGGNQVDADKAARVAGQDLGRADAATVRAQTGFAIGGVAPIGHLNPTPIYFDPRLNDFNQIWAAAGTPRHVFPIAPAQLLQLTGAMEADFTA
ncbi:prolyl-tRNA synthetase [Thalassobacter stenotrophicus]|uniref:YbaK/EbsC family protein n=1 Tax=Thalassobacter TaxID=266808 RepID=UPI00051D21E4|nr:MULTISPECIES: YbaK/EbsC family protein [Thalassobacter]KGK79077.1 prolyl-tRNA synthetase [Thalassobacter stenotrophicus]KGL02977.1 prolyl-tRNA synthetase [Thalassobacter sp. 16PALIMAR09]